MLVVNDQPTRDIGSHGGGHNTSMYGLSHLEGAERGSVSRGGRVTFSPLFSVTHYHCGLLWVRLITRNANEEPSINYPRT